MRRATSGKRRESVGSVPDTESKNLTNDILEPEINSDSEAGCAEKTKLSREERLMLWKAQKQASSKVSKKNGLSSDSHLAVLTSSQLNAASSSSASLTCRNISVVSHEAKRHPPTQFHDSKRHCSSSKRRDSQMPPFIQKEKPTIDTGPGATGRVELQQGKEMRCEAQSTIAEPRLSADDPVAAISDVDSSKCEAAIPVKEDGMTPEVILDQDIHAQESQEGPSTDELKQQIFDQSSRLIKCSSLLKRLLDEHEQLRAKLSDHQALKERCSQLENTITEVSLLYQVSQLTPTPQASSGEDVQCNSIRTQFLEESIKVKDREIAKLRGRLSTMEAEFKEERERLIRKMMAAEEGKRVSEAACKENDAMWEQLFETKMRELQSTCADALRLQNASRQPETASPDADCGQGVPADEAPWSASPRGGATGIAGAADEERAGAEDECRDE